jgi:hypothetical protein
VNLFDWLVVAHLVGDFLLQTDDMANLKTEDWGWMARHVAVYMMPLSVVLLIYSIIFHLPAWSAIIALLFLAATHALLDRRRFTISWMRFARTAPDQGWLPIVADQVFHVVTLAVVAQFLVLARG